MTVHVEKRVINHRPEDLFALVGGLFSLCREHLLQRGRFVMFFRAEHGLAHPPFRNGLLMPVTHLLVIFMFLNQLI